MENTCCYDETADGAGDGEGKKTTHCLFMNSAPAAINGGGFIQRLLKRRMKRWLGDETAPVCKCYEMSCGQDYPYGLRLSFTKKFWEHIPFHKRTHVGIIDGDALKRKDLIDLIRQSYDRMNYLTIFSKEPEAYRELIQDAWEQLGLAVTVTASLRETVLCDYILDCTTAPFAQRLSCRNGCCFFSVYAGREKSRSIRRLGNGIRFDSCHASLDRAFHNKV